MSLINEIASHIKEQDEEEGIEIFFDNLDEQTQKAIMEALREELNVSDNDEYANNKMLEAMAKRPIVTIRASEIKKLMNFDF